MELYMVNYVRTSIRCSWLMHGDSDKHVVETSDKLRQNSGSVIWLHLNDTNV